MTTWKMCNARHPKPGTAVWDLYKDDVFQQTGDYTVLFNLVRDQKQPGDIYIEDQGAHGIWQEVL